jgi:hypothetical protein
LSRGRAWFQSINWRREAIYPAQALAETCLAAPWLMLFLSAGQPVSPEQVAALCLAILLGTLYLARLMSALDLNAWVQRGLVLLEIAILSTLAVRQFALIGTLWARQGWARVPVQPGAWLVLLPGIVILVLSVTWLCWRGLRLADAAVSLHGAALEFHLGIAGLSMFALVSASPALLIFVPAFFFSQLLAISLIRLETVAQESGRARLGLSGWWLGLLLGASGALVILGGSVSALVLGLGPDQLAFWLAPVIGILTLPLILLAYPLMLVFAWLWQFIRLPFEAIAAQLASLLAQFQGWLNQIGGRPISPIVWMALRLTCYGIGALVVLTVLGVLIAVVWSAGRKRLTGRPALEELHESAWPGEALLQKLYARLRQRLARWRALMDIAARLGASGLFAALTIRRLYAQMIRLAASHGFPRPPAHTPYEHLITLQQAWPDCHTDLEQITEAYVGVHYGELPEQPNALEAIRAAFERIRSIVDK